MLESNTWTILKILIPGALIVLFARALFDIILPELIQKYRRNEKFKAGAKWRNDRDLLQWLRGMNPTEFEEYVATLFSKLGYEAKAVGKAHDGGIDVVMSKNGITDYAQCKRYNSPTVSSSEVRDFYGALADRLAKGKGYFITTNIFSLDAQKFAEGKPIELVDGNRLVEYIRLAEKNGFTATSSEPSQSQEKICPECNVGKLIVKNGKFGKFYGCSNYPQCKYTQNI